MQAFALEAFRELSARWIWPALLHSVWTGLVTAAISALILQSAMLRSHRARHAILVGALALVVTGTALATALQRAVAFLAPVDTSPAWEITGESTASEAAETGDGQPHSPMLVAAQYQVPTPVERRCETTCEIPEGSSLLISLGMRERRGRSSDAAETASEILELVGLPPLPARSVTCERLVSITPRRVMPSPDEASTRKRTNSIKIERNLQPPSAHP